MIDLEEKTVKIDKFTIGFINTCFGKIDWDFRDALDFSISDINDAYYKFINMSKWVFDYNCTDCRFPKFKNLETGDTEACPNCGD